MNESMTKLKAYDWGGDRGSLAGIDERIVTAQGNSNTLLEIEEALLDGRVDVAVHSMKDMPAEMPEGLCIGPVPQREDPRDVLISKNGLELSELPDGASIGTSSLRRSAPSSRSLRRIPP